MAIQCLGFKEVQKGSLVGFATLFFESMGMEVREVAFFRKNGREWVSPPSREYEKRDGTKGYFNYFSFPARPRYEQFQQAAVAAINEHLKSNSYAGSIPQEEDPDDVPF